MQSASRFQLLKIGINFSKNLKFQNKKDEKTTLAMFHVRKTILSPQKLCSGLLRIKRLLVKSTNEVV